MAGRRESTTEAVRPALDDDEVLQALRNAHGVVHTLLQATLVDFHLILTEYRALGHLARQGELTPTALSALLDITPASTTELIDRLERRHLVRRRPNPADRRSMLVGLTAKGVETYGAARAVYRRSVSRVSERMSKAGRGRLVRGIGEFLRVFRGDTLPRSLSRPAVMARRPNSR